MRALRNFLHLVWPEAGDKAIITIENGTPKHYWFSPQQTEEAISKIKELAGSGIDVYMALGGFDDTHSRKAEHALVFKTLFLDLDCGEGKDYPDQDTARRALNAFVAASELPIPYVVSSGFGLHVYWPLEKEIAREEWLVLATALKSVCKTFAFKADDSCTADAARILRPNGSFNFKNGQPRRVQVLEQGNIVAAEDLKERLLKQAGNIFNELARKKVTSSTLDTSFSTEWTPVELDDILPHCATLRWAYENQNEVREPLWYAVVGLAGYCTDPVATVHRLSKNAASYNPDHAEAKLAQWRSSVSGPPTCAGFKGINGNKCEGCPAKVSTPLSLGRPRNAVQTLAAVLNTASDFKHHHLRVNGNGLQIQMQQGKPDKNGATPPPEWIKIADYGIRPLLNIKLFDKDGKATNHVWMETYNETKSRDQFIVPSSSVNQSAVLATECAKYGLINEQENFPSAFRSFTSIMRAWIRSLEQQQGTAITFDSFGWMGPEGAQVKDAFLLGNKLYTKDHIRTIPILPHLKEYQEAMVSRGTLDEWTKAINNYNLPGMEPYMYTSWCAWGAPLMCFTNSQNIVVSLVGDTGVGKSSLQRSIASVYGNYHSKILVDQHNSTLNSVNANLGCLNSLPYIREEGAETDPVELASWILAMTQGRERGRLTSALARAQVRTWATIAILSSNVSIREIVVNTRKDNAARLARCWEANMKLPMSQEEAASLFRPLQNNYGLAGPIYIDSHAKNYDDVGEAVRSTETTLMNKFHATGDSRFHISLMAANFVGARIAIQLGLIDHDFNRGRDYAYKQFKLLHKAAADEKRTAEQMLAQLVQELRPVTLVVEYDLPGSATTVFDSNNNIIHSPPANSMIKARYAADVGIYYVDANTLRKWYVDNHLNYHSSMAELKTLGVLLTDDRKVVLTKGTKLADKTQVRCVWFDLTKSQELVEALSEA